MNPLLEAMKAAGLSDAAISAIEKRMTPRPRVPLGALACPGCGHRTLRGDFVCGKCSRFKAEFPKRFWHQVRVLSGAVLDDRWLLGGIPAYRPEPEA